MACSMARPRGSWTRTVRSVMPWVGLSNDTGTSDIPPRPSTSNARLPTPRVGEVARITHRPAGSVCVARPALSTGSGEIFSSPRKRTTASGTGWPPWVTATRTVPGLQSSSSSMSLGPSRSLRSRTRGAVRADVTSIWRLPTCRSSRGSVPALVVRPISRPSRDTRAPSTGLPSGSTTRSARSARPPSESCSSKVTVCSTVESSGITTVFWYTPRLSLVSSTVQVPGSRVVLYRPVGGMATGSRGVDPAEPISRITASVTSASPDRATTSTCPGSHSSWTTVCCPPGARVIGIRSDDRMRSWDTSRVRGPGVRRSRVRVPPVEIAPRSTPSRTTRAPSTARPWGSTTSISSLASPASAAWSTTTTSMSS